MYDLRTNHAIDQPILILVESDHCSWTCRRSFLAPQIKP